MTPAGGWAELARLSSHWARVAEARGAGEASEEGEEGEAEAADEGEAAEAVAAKGASEATVEQGDEDEDDEEEGLAAAACEAPLLPSSLDSVGFLGGGAGRLHLQDSYFLDARRGAHTTSFTLRAPSRLRAYVAPHAVDVDLALLRLPPRPPATPEEGGDAAGAGSAPSSPQQRHAGAGAAMVAQGSSTVGGEEVIDASLEPGRCALQLN